VTALFQQGLNIVQEGFQGGSVVATRNGKKIKRKRTVENMQEGINWDPLNVGGAFEKAGDDFKKAGDDMANWFNKLGNQMSDGFEKVKNGFDDMKNFFDKIGDFFRAIGDFFEAIGEFFNRVFGNIGKIFTEYLPKVFKVIGCNIKCWFNFIANLNNCFGWYFLDVIGKTLYIPIGFIFWLFNLENIENKIWEYLEEIDCICKNLTGFHLIHYSDSINKKCYSCCCDDFPGDPGYDWTFHFDFNRFKF
jgi:hypothetical protein